MARVVWDRLENIRESRDTIKYKQKPSFENFRPPSQIETDFRRL